MTVCLFPDEQGLVAVENGVPTRRPLDGRGRIESRTLPACTALCIVHRGPYEELDRSYRALQHWLETHRVDTAADPREIYHTNPAEVSDPADYVTEIAWPILPEHARRARGQRDKFEQPLRT